MSESIESIETRVAEAASDYKMGLDNEGFANECGGVDKLRDDLFALVDEWGGELDEADETMKVTREDIGQVLTSIASRFDEELLSTPECELEKNWHFKWDETASIEWNTYKFSDMLEMFKRTCRRWEEHHNGSGCVVERVRDKYLMPKIRGFLAELQAHNGKGHENAD